MARKQNTSGEGAMLLTALGFGAAFWALLRLSTENKELRQREDLLERQPPVPPRPYNYPMPPVDPHGGAIVDPFRGQRRSADWGDVDDTNALQYVSDEAYALVPRGRPRLFRRTYVNAYGQRVIGPLEMHPTDRVVEWVPRYTVLG